MHGCGNDFLILDYMKEDNVYPVPKHEVMYLCDRNFGLGADGLVAISRGRVTDALWKFYNCDGEEADMCGNAARCVIRFLADHYLRENEVISLETRAGVIKGKRLDEENVEITLLSEGLRHTDYEEKVIRVGEEAIRMYCISTGVPHAVIEVKDIRSYPINEVGAALVRHSAFENGTNVTFFQLEMHPKIYSTTFERGVEKETFACGTGAAAAALIYSQLYLQPLPVEVVVPGGVLTVEISPVAHKLLLRGPATYVWQTELDELPNEFVPRTLYGTRKVAP